VAGKCGSGIVYGGDETGLKLARYESYAAVSWEDDPPVGWAYPDSPISGYADFWKIVPESD
jgi:hypothetical protein